MALLSRSKKEKTIIAAAVPVSQLRAAVLQLLQMLTTAAMPEAVKSRLPQKILAKSLRDSLELMTDTQLADGIRAMAKYSAELEAMAEAEGLLPPRQTELKLIDCNDDGNRQS